MTQAKRIAKEIAYLANGLSVMLQDDCSDTESHCTIVHTLGRIFALNVELHSLFDITLIEQQGGE